MLGSACGYVLARRGSKLSTGVYFLFVAGIVIPFWLGLVPIYVTLRDLHLTGTYLGMIVLNVGLMLPLTVFLYTGFIRMLPKEYEEAAQVDGAGLVPHAVPRRAAAARARSPAPSPCSPGSSAGTTSSCR